MSVKYFNEQKQDWDKIASIFATSINVADIGGNYQSSNVEGCLREIADVLSGKVDDIILVDNILNFYADGVLVKSVEIDSFSQEDRYEISQLKNTKIDDIGLSVIDNKVVMTLFANNQMLKSIEFVAGGAEECYIYVGESEPTQSKYEVWIDTSDDEEVSTNMPDLVIDEFREIIKSLKAEVQSLKQVILEHEVRIEYLELNGGGNGGGGSGGDTGTTYVPLAFEDGSIMTFEDGSIMTFEEKQTSTNSTRMIFEDLNQMIFESNEYLIFE